MCSHSVARILLAMFSLLLAMPGASESSAAGIAVRTRAMGAVRGELTAAGPRSLPPDAQIEVSLLDVSLADAPARSLADPVRVVPALLPYRFSIPYSPADVIDSHRYVVQARVTHHGRLLFVTDRSYPVLTHGEPDTVNVLMVPVAMEPALPMPGSDRDVHGCIASAGYSWCERLSACARPWELAAERRLPPGEASFRAYCG